MTAVDDSPIPGRYLPEELTRLNKKAGDSQITQMVRNWDDRVELIQSGALRIDEFFDVPFRAVDDDDRSRSLKRLASDINLTYSSKSPIGRPDALVLVTPEGYGKSSLIAYLLSHGFRIVFCAKSNAQLIQKEKDIRDKWPKMPEVRKIARGLGRLPTVTRYISKEQNLQARLEESGVAPRSYKLASYESDNPYAIAAVNEEASIAALEALFKRHRIDEDAKEFFQTHYLDYKAQNLKDCDSDILLLTFAHFQALTTKRKPSWWARLGLISSHRKILITEENIDRFTRKRRTRKLSKRKKPQRETRRQKEDDKKVKVGDTILSPIPYKKIAVVIDDPDRSDVDWLRRVSEDAADKLSKARKEITEEDRAEESTEYWKDTDLAKKAELASAMARERNRKLESTPIHKVVEVGGTKYIERPVEATFGNGLLDRKVNPRLIVTTTECLTAAFSHRTLLRTELRVLNRINVFQSIWSNVTSICTTITRQSHHAVLLPIVEKLKEEFPAENVTLIADGLGCEFNLSNNKGRNDLEERTTIIKLSWPHPATISALMANVAEYIPYDTLIGIHLADLANQALGRNQGFRFNGKQAILLIDSRFYPTLMQGGMIRYKLNPWSDKLPKFNKKTSKRSTLNAIQMAAEQSPFEQRLIELIANFEEFGTSDEAKRLAERLPDVGRKHFEKWLSKAESPETAALAAVKAEKRRIQNLESQRRFQARKNAASTAGTISDVALGPPDEAQR